MSLTVLHTGRVIVVTQRVAMGGSSTRLRSNSCWRGLRWNWNRDARRHSRTLPCWRRLPWSRGRAASWHRNRSACCSCLRVLGCCDLPETSFWKWYGVRYQASLSGVRDTARGENTSSMSVTAHLVKSQKTHCSVAHVHASCCQKCCFSPSASRVEFIDFSRGVSIIAALSMKHFRTYRLRSSCRLCSLAFVAHWVLARRSVPSRCQKFPLIARFCLR